MAKGKAMDVGLFCFFFNFSKAFDCLTMDSKIIMRFLQIQDILFRQFKFQFLAMKTPELMAVGYNVTSHN